MGGSAVRRLGVFLCYLSGLEWFGCDFWLGCLGVFGFNLIESFGKYQLSSARSSCSLWELWEHS